MTKLAILTPQFTQKVSMVQKSDTIFEVSDQKHTKLSQKHLRN